MDAFLVEAYSDIDSAMGKGSAIGFRHRASIFPVGLFKETLTKTVNWTHKIVMGGTVSSRDFYSLVPVAHPMIGIPD